MYIQPFGKPAAACYSDCPPAIEVSGEGTVTAAPDRAVVVLGVINEGPVLQTVQTENAKIMADVINSLLALDIPREHIQTTDFRIEAQYDYHEGKQIFRGYKVTHLVSITTGRVGQTGVIVDTAVAHGANTVNSIRFTVAHPEYYANQALARAVEKARQKALTIASALGVALAAVPSQVQELPRSAEPVPFASMAFEAGAATPIQPGQLTVSAAVRVWYLFG